MSPRKRTSGQTAVRLLLVVLLLGLALVFTIIVARDYIEVQEVPLPDFIGLDVEAAQQQLAGLATLDQLGASATATLARRRLRDTGVTGIPRGPQDAARSHPAGLTRRQAEVLDLVRRVMFGD